jgi:uncharacterized phage protein (TIGR02220 family)
MPAGRIILKSISQSRKLALLKTDGARLLYTWLLTHLDINGCFSGDPEIVNGQVFTRLKKPVRKVEEFLADLDDVGLVIRYQANGDTFLHVPDFQDKQPNLNPEREAKSEIPLPSPELLQSRSGAGQDEVQKKSLLSKVKQSKVKDNVELLDRILDYFNQVTGQKRKSEEAKRLIRGRLAEGRTFEDFKHVIDTKTAQWIRDVKMRKYLRPSTLFREGNFEDYLNEPYQDPKKASRPDDHGQGEHRVSQVGKSDKPVDKVYWEKYRKKEAELRASGLSEAEVRTSMAAWTRDQRGEAAV